MLGGIVQESNMKKIIRILLATVIIGSTLAVSLPRVKISSEGTLAFEFNIVQAAPSFDNMGGTASYAQINSTRVHKGRVQINLNLYLDPVSSYYNYTLKYMPDENSPEFQAGYPGKVDKDGVPLDIDDYYNWLYNIVPWTWKAVPFHNHTIYCDKDTSEVELKDRIGEVLKWFSGFYVTEVWGKQDFLTVWEQVPWTISDIRTKLIAGDTSPPEIEACQDKADEIYDNKDDYGREIDNTGEFSVDLVEATITVGSDAIDRSSINACSIITMVDGNLAANDDGTIDTVNVYWGTSAGTDDVYFGTFSASGNTLTCRDSESVGDVTGNSLQQYTGLDIDILTDDYIGTHSKAAAYLYLEKDNSGYTRIWEYSGECIDPSDSQTFSNRAGDAVSLNGTGNGGATPDISNTPSTWSVNGGSTLSTSSDYWSSGSPPVFPLDDGECYFTVTNNSGAAVDIDIKATNFTGGVGWTLAGSPGEDIVTMKAGVSGDANEGAMVTLTTSDQSFISALADSGTKKWELKLETGTFTDGVTKSSTVTLTATLT